MIISKQPTNPSTSIAGLFLLLAWLSALFFHGLSLYGLVAAQSFLVLALLGSLWRLGHSPIAIPRNALLLSLLALSLWLVLSLNWSLAPQVSRLHLWILLSLPAAFIIYALADISLRHWQALTVIVFVAACLLAMNVIWLAHHGETRLSSIFLNPNSLAALLNLVALLAVAGFLTPAQNNYTNALFGCVLFVLVYAIGLIQSRGAILCLLTTLLLLVYVCRHVISRSGFLSLVAIVALGLLVSSLEIHHSIAAPLEVVLSTERIDQGRLAIWGPAWQLVKDSPWVGSGIGLFWLLYPQVRLATEASAGFYAHNDYLQLWVEAGLPAVLLLIAVLLSTLYLYSRFMRNNNTAPIPVRLEASGLFFGLLAVAAHSLVTFNFYILSILILCGIFLGRLNQLAHTNSDTSLTLQGPAAIKPGVFQGLLLISALVPLGFIAAEQFANHYQHQAAKQRSTADFVGADASLRKARQFLHSDALLLDQAGLYYRILQVLPVTEKEKRSALFNDCLHLLAKVERMNPLRARLYLLRGQLYTEHPDLGGANAGQSAQAAFQKAVSLNPRDLHARFGLAGLYLREGDQAAAWSVLNEGLLHDYSLSADMLPYLQRYARLQPPGPGANVARVAIEKERLESILKTLAQTKPAENLTISE